VEALAAACRKRGKGLRLPLEGGDLARVVGTARRERRPKDAKEDEAHGCALRVLGRSLRLGDGQFVELGVDPVEFANDLLAVKASVLPRRCGKRDDGTGLLGTSRSKQGHGQNGKGNQAAHVMLSPKVYRLEFSNRVCHSGARKGT